MKQLDLLEWAESRPTAKIIDIKPALISKIAAQPYPFPIRNGELVTLKRGAA
ncbi:MAG TPA: hypothetical protein VGN93_13340 [Shinella sp.]|jgi:hypothetical protein|uniref:hypothetical protein n=1 Tax=Shinella sp. TaxID=1870904 RepID=UPI002E0D6D20|nr:hypothetical protein [Shinella sp.]